MLRKFRLYIILNPGFFWPLNMLFRPKLTSLANQAINNLKNFNELTSHRK